MALDARIKAAEAYLDKLKGRVLEPTPSKHLGHPETYKAYLENEVRLAQAKLERLKGV